MLVEDCEGGLEAGIDTWSGMRNRGWSGGFGAGELGEDSFETGGLGLRGWWLVLRLRRLGSGLLGVENLEERADIRRCWCGDVGLVGRTWGLGFLHGQKLSFSELSLRLVRGDVGE